MNRKVESREVSDLTLARVRKKIKDSGYEISGKIIPGLSELDPSVVPIEKVRKTLFSPKIEEVICRIPREKKPRVPRIIK